MQCIAVTPEDMHNCKFHCELLLVGESIVQLSGHGSLEEQLQAAVPDWQQAFCSTFGRSNGHPSCLLISPAALGAIAMIKSFPAFNKVTSCDLDRFWCSVMHTSQQQYRKDGQQTIASVHRLIHEGQEQELSAAYFMSAQSHRFQLLMCAVGCHAAN